MPSDKDINTLRYGCVINVTDVEAFFQSYEELEHSIQELSSAIETRRIKRAERKLKVKQKD